MANQRAARVSEVEAKSAGFRKELGLGTLILTQIMYIVGSGWVGTAAKLGTGTSGVLVSGDRVVLSAASGRRDLA